MKYIFVASDQEVQQAQREAERRYEEDLFPEEVDPRKKDTRIRHKFIGYLGEIVLCRTNGWKRNFPPQRNLPDACRPDGSSVEIKTRSKWSREEIPVKPCDLAMLLYYFVNEKKQQCFQVVQSYPRDYFLGRNWNIFIKEKLWNAYLKDVLSGDLDKMTEES
jgi:hypothetical protein